MSSSGKNGCGFSFVLLLLFVSLGMNVFLGCRCLNPKAEVKSEVKPVRDPSAEIISDLRELAQSCGVKDVESKGAYELISDVKMKFKDQKYYGSVLSAEEKAELKDSLADSPPQLLKKVLAYDEHIRNQAR